MKALSITQPWASLIAQGAKRIETRNWSTTYRGPLAIHASKGLPAWVAKVVRNDPAFTSALGNLFDPHGRTLGDLPRGCIIATCRLIAVKFITADSVGWDLAWTEPTLNRSYPITAQERSFGDYTPERYAWLLEDVQPLDVPIPTIGQLGLWQWEQP